VEPILLYLIYPVPNIEITKTNLPGTMAVGTMVVVVKVVETKMAVGTIT